MTFWKPPVAIAHRGSRLLWPENTMEGFSAATDLGVTHVETDLRVTADGMLVCFHDPTLDRTTSGTGPISAMSWTELQQLDAGYRHGPERIFRDKGIRVPALEELVTSFPDVGIVAEMKADETPEPLARLIDTYSLHDRIIVASFSDQRLARFRQLTAGRVRTSAGMAATRRWVLSRKRGMPPIDGASALQVPVQSRGLRVVDERLVRFAHESGLDIHVWTVNDEAEMRRLLDMGVDGLISDRPDLLQKLITERNGTT